MGRLVALLVPIAVLFSACTQTPAVRAPTRELAPSALTFQVPADRRADDVGRFLAGLPGKPGSPFLDLEQRPEWQEHARLCDAAWGKFERERLPAMQQFARQELAGLRDSTETVFYPFGGADALTVTTFFPKHPRWALVALEPPGTLWTAESLDTPALGPRLAAFRATLDSLLAKSFFVTRQMDHQLRGQIADGVLVDLLVELVRRGYTIRGSQYLELTADGKIVQRTDPPHLGLKNRGVALEMEDPEHAIHQMYFLSVNLANDRLKQNPRFETVTLSGAKVVTLLKSTSYLPHHENFTDIRDLILKHSAAVLQDDSGIPYRFFAERRWTSVFYGNYSTPFYPFQWRAQKDLREAFASRQNVRPLAFPIGYGFGRIPSNLTLALAPADLLAGKY